jgi:protein-arginine kinase
MKKVTNFDFANISKEQSIELTSVVKETIAMEFMPVKNFTAVDLWNIQRSNKTRISSRHLV